MTSYSREEVETYLEIFNSVADAMGAGWKERDAALAVERRLLADLTLIIFFGKGLQVNSICFLSNPFWP